MCENKFFDKAMEMKVISKNDFCVTLGDGNVFTRITTLFEEVIITIEADMAEEFVKSLDQLEKIVPETKQLKEIKIENCFGSINDMEDGIQFKVTDNDGTIQNLYKNSGIAVCDDKIEIELECYENSTGVDHLIFTMCCVNTD